MWESTIHLTTKIRIIYLVITDSMTGPHILFPTIFLLHGSHRIFLPVPDLNFLDFSYFFADNRP